MVVSDAAFGMSNTILPLTVLPGASDVHLHLGHGSDISRPRVPSDADTETAAKKLSEARRLTSAKDYAGAIAAFDDDPSWSVLAGITALYLCSHLFRMLRLALLTLDERDKVFLWWSRNFGHVDRCFGCLFALESDGWQVPQC